MFFSMVCSHCDTKGRCNKRDFSEQAWSALLVWEEIDRTTVDQPLCDTCYDELREVLIDRSHEIQNAASQPPPKKIPASVAKKPPASTAKATASHSVKGKSHKVAVKAKVTAKSKKAKRPSRIAS